MAEIFTLGLINDAALQGYWRFENNVNDSSPNGYNLTANNAPTYTTGQYGKAISIGSSSQQSANIPKTSAPNLDITGAQTWVCWVNPTTISSYQAVMSLGNASGSVHNLMMSADSAGNPPYFTLHGLTTNNQVQGSVGTLSTGSWAHVAGVYNGTSLFIYVNAALWGSVAATGAALTIGGTFAIGNRGDATVLNYNGLVDDAAIFNRALSQAEINSLYLQGAYMKLNKLWGV